MEILLTRQEKRYIGKWIQWKRKENKLSQEEFLEAYPLCARKTLSRLENGKENVREELLEDLLSVFGMRIPEVSDFQSVFSRSEWKRLSRVYDLYDESLLQKCIHSMWI
ncbi:helix-turn-helix domain-containing protein [Dubosiella newyorkensis]|uniref:helix-turn-helix domain-containing protein n=2 Tax=Dubosiella newyorkensis TaxID=1862672 RepID=UPI00257273E0|nr:helix-turn-helix transcriptional regulator [Dubosiella newyorkensis]